MLWHFECLHQPERFQLLTHTPRSGATKYRLNERAWGLGAPCLEVSLTSVDTDEGTPSPALSRYALTPGDKSDAQISADRAANTRTNTSQRAPHEFDASVPNWASGVSAHDDAEAEREARDADYLDWINRNLKIGTPSDDREYAWDEQANFTCDSRCLTCHVCRRCRMLSIRSLQFHFHTPDASPCGTLGAKSTGCRITTICSNIRAHDPSLPTSIFYGTVTSTAARQLQCKMA